MIATWTLAAMRTAVPVMPVESNRGKKSGGEEGKNLAARQQRLKERGGGIAPANLQSDSRAIGWPTGRHVVSKQASNSSSRQ
jgi:hypothetical protein